MTICTFCPTEQAITVVDENFPQAYCLGCYETALVIRAKSLGGRIQINEHGDVIDVDPDEEVTNIREYGDQDDELGPCDCGHDGCESGDLEDE